MPKCSNKKCDAEGLKKCAKCLSVCYCSRECQLADWEAGHKKLCKTLKQKPEEQRLQPIQIPLINAVKSKSLQEVKSLLQGGCVINEQNEYGETPLSHAVSLGYTKIVEELITAGADLNICCQEGLSPLFIAAHNNHSEIVELFVNSGKVDINYHNKRAATALFMAAQLGHTKTLDVLIKAGADPNILFQGCTPLFMAAQNNHIKIVKLLVNTPEVDINYHNERFATALFMAVQEGYTDIVEVLIKAGADPNICFHEGPSPLAGAVHEDHRKMVELLVKSDKLNIDYHTEQIATPLFLAVQEGYTDIVDVLIKAGANPNIRYKKDIFPLFKAVLENYPDIVNLLAHSPQIQINQQDKFGITALSLAAEAGYTDIVDVLIKAGANPDIWCEEGTSPLFWAAQNNHIEIVKLLANRSKVDLATFTPLQSASAAGHLGVVKILLSCNSGYDITGLEDLNEAVNQAKIRGHLRIFRFLQNKITELTSLKLEKTKLPDCNVISPISSNAPVSPSPSPAPDLHNSSSISSMPPPPSPAPNLHNSSSISPMSPPPSFAPGLHNSGSISPMSPPPSFAPGLHNSSFISPTPPSPSLRSSKPPLRNTPTSLSRVQSRTPSLFSTCAQSRDPSPSSARAQSRGPSPFSARTQSRDPSPFPAPTQSRDPSPSSARAQSRDPSPNRTAYNLEKEVMVYNAQFQINIDGVPNTVKYGLPLSPGNLCAHLFENQRRIEAFFILSPQVRGHLTEKIALQVESTFAVVRSARGCQGFKLYDDQELEKILQKNPSIRDAAIREGTTIGQYKLKFKSRELGDVRGLCRCYLPQDFQANSDSMQRPLFVFFALIDHEDKQIKI